MRKHTINNLKAVFKAPHIFVNVYLNFSYEIAEYVLVKRFL